MERVWRGELEDVEREECQVSVFETTRTRPHLLCYLARIAWCVPVPSPRPPRPPHIRLAFATPASHNDATDGGCCWWWWLLLVGC